MIRIVDLLVKSSIRNIVLDKASKYNPQLLNVDRVKEAKEDYNILYNCLSKQLQDTATKYSVSVHTDKLLFKYIDVMVELEAKDDTSIEVLEDIISRAYKFHFIMHGLVSEIIKYEVFNKLIYKIICDKNLEFLSTETIDKFKKDANINEGRIKNLNKGLKLLSSEEDEDYSIVEYIGIIHGVIDDINFNIKYSEFKKMYEENKLEPYLYYLVDSTIKEAKG